MEVRREHVSKTPNLLFAQQIPFDDVSSAGRRDGLLRCDLATAIGTHGHHPVSIPGLEPFPRLDSFYGRGHERPVYFVSGEPQQRGKFMNNTTGTSSTAGKFTSAFGLGAQLYKNINSSYSKLLTQKAGTAYAFAQLKPGVTQTASVKSPYIYAEDNWVDDMELGYAAYNKLINYGGKSR